MIHIAHRIASTRIIQAWSEPQVRFDVISDVQEGVDQESSLTHHNLDADDMDKTNQDNSEPLQFEPPSIAL